MTHGFPIPETIDHINNVKDDNRLCNLQPFDLANQTRKNPSSANKWFYMGVRKVSTNTWGYSIMINRKRRSKGGFTNPLAAATAYIRRLHSWELTGE